jgi:hypothetical protein
VAERVLHRLGSPPRRVPKTPPTPRPGRNTRSDDGLGERAHAAGMGSHSHIATLAGLGPRPCACLVPRLGGREASARTPNRSNAMASSSESAAAAVIVVVVGGGGVVGTRAAGAGPACGDAEVSACSAASLCMCSAATRARSSSLRPAALHPNNQRVGFGWGTGGSRSDPRPRRTTDDWSHSHAT